MAGTAHEAVPAGWGCGGGEGSLSASRGGAPWHRAQGPVGLIVVIYAATITACTSRRAWRGGVSGDHHNAALRCGCTKTGAKVEEFPGGCTQGALVGGPTAREGARRGARRSSDEHQRRAV